jgi:hypothetical protein
MRSAKGTLKWNDKVLAQKAKNKWNKHGCNYDVIGYAVTAMLSKAMRRW